MKKLTIVVLLFLSTLAYGQQVPPQGINFQAVLFDEFGTPVPSINENSTLNNQSAEATFTFFNITTGLNYYSESHNISTDEFGRFQVVLGRGTPIGSNTFQDIIWSDGDIFLDFEVAINGQAKRLVSSQELLSVPYALFAGGIQGNNDLDPDPSNEIQELSIDSDSIYISDANAIPIPYDGDKSSSNEIQSLSLTGNQITISNGNTISLPTNLDNSPTNELQILSTQGDSLTISNGNTVITDPSSTNELQSILLTPAGYLKLSKSMDSVYSYVNYDSIAFKLLQDTSFTNAVTGNGYSLECVNMGVSAACYSLGIDSSITLKPNDSYTYSLSTRHTTNSSTVSQQVNWRKFRLTGIDTSSFEGLVLKYKRNKVIANSGSIVKEDIMVSIDPSVVNGVAYFYIYAYQSRQDKSCGTSNGGSCVYNGRLTSVPAANTWYVRDDCWTFSNSTGASDIEILIKDGNSYKNTGVMFDISVQQ